MRFTIFLIMFFMIVSLIIVNNYELHISEKGDFKVFLEVYADWFKIFFSNIKAVTGNVVSQNWFPE